MKRLNGFRRKRGGGNNSTVTYRPEEDDLLELIRRADRLRVSRHLLGREYVSQMLAVEQDRSDVLAALQQLFFTITELRKDVAIGVEAILLASGQFTEKEAHEWVVSQFKIHIPDDNHNEIPPV